MKKLLLLSMMLWAGLAQAQVRVEQPWVRATVAQQKATGAFLTITASSDSRLVEVRSPAARMVELHQMALEGGVMKMSEIEGGIDLPAGKAVALKPGSLHVMMMGLAQPLSAGESVPLTLVIESKKDKKRELVEVRAEVRQLGASSAPAR